MEEEEITIPRSVYDRLVDRDFKLSCLEQGGVDNWEWYGEALQAYWAEQDDE